MTNQPMEAAQDPLAGEEPTAKADSGLTHIDKLPRMDIQNHRPIDRFIHPAQQLSQTESVESAAPTPEPKQESATDWDLARAWVYQDSMVGCDESTVYPDSRRSATYSGGKSSDASAKGVYLGKRTQRR